MKRAPACGCKAATPRRASPGDGPDSAVQSRLRLDLAVGIKHGNSWSQGTLDALSFLGRYEALRAPPMQGFPGRKG